jgi:hypothetical protein
MKIVKVTYTIKSEFVEQNRKNIEIVMADLQQSNHAGILYHTCLAPDGKTFIHTAFFKSDDDQKVLNELTSFRHFQEQLKASGPEAPPKQELLTLIGSSVTIFK